MTLEMTSENIDRLVDEAYPGRDAGDHQWLRGLRHDLHAAAVRLAAPAKVEPKWPEGQVYAWFDRDDGRYATVDKEQPRFNSSEYISVPCRVVPADAVVIGLELLPDLLQIVCYAEAAARRMGNWEQVDTIGDILGHLRALRAERGGQP